MDHSGHMDHAGHEGHAGHGDGCDHGGHAMTVSIFISCRPEIGQADKYLLRSHCRRTLTP